MDTTTQGLLRLQVAGSSTDGTQLILNLLQDYCSAIQGLEQMWMSGGANCCWHHKAVLRDWMLTGAAVRVHVHADLDKSC